MIIGQAYIEYAQMLLINAHADASSHARGISWHLLPLYVCEQRLLICTDSPEQSLLADALSIEISRIANMVSELESGALNDGWDTRNKRENKQVIYIISLTCLKPKHLILYTG